MDLDLIICAQSASVDQATNNLSLFTIIQEISAPSFPIGVPMSVVILLSRTKRDSSHADLVLKGFLSGNLTPIFNFPFNVVFGDKLRARWIVNVPAMIFTAPGLFSFQVFRENKNLGQWQIEILNVGQAALGSSPTLAPFNQPLKEKPKRARRRARRK